MTNGILEKPAPSGEDDVRQYLDEIRKFPLLTPQQERQLAMACAKGDEEAIRQMVNSNLRLVVSVAREYAGRGVPLMDLIQEGSIGLLAAAKKFDYTLEYRFSTYATKWIRQGISRCLQNHGLIRVPGHTAEQIHKILAAKHSLMQAHSEEPTAEMIAQACAMSPERVEKLLKMIPQTCSLDAPIGDEEEIAIGSLLEDVQSPQPEQQLVRDELNHTMHKLLSHLTQRHQQVLRLRFGMEDGVCYSLDQTGVKLGISKERARQLERQAIRKLQKLGTGLGLEDFLND